MDNYHSYGHFSASPPEPYYFPDYHLLRNVLDKYGQYHINYYRITGLDQSVFQCTCIFLSVSDTDTFFYCGWFLTALHFQLLSSSPDPLLLYSCTIQWIFLFWNLSSHSFRRLLLSFQQTDALVAVPSLFQFLLIPVLSARSFA